MFHTYDVGYGEILKPCPCCEMLHGKTEVHSMDIEYPKYVYICSNPECENYGKVYS